MAAQKVRACTLVTSHRNLSRSGDGLHRLHARHARLPGFCRPIQKRSQTCVRAGLAAAAAATDGPGKCGAVQTYMINAYTCLAKSCLLHSTFRLDVTIDYLWIRPPKRKRVQLDYWTGLDRIGLDCTDCLPVAGISPQVGIIKLSQPCVRVLEQASD